MSQPDAQLTKAALEAKMAQDEVDVILDQNLMAKIRAGPDYVEWWVWLEWTRKRRISLRHIGVSTGDKTYCGITIPVAACSWFWEADEAPEGDVRRSMVCLRCRAGKEKWG